MNNKKKIALLAMSLCAGTTFAQDPAAAGKWYVGADIGQAKLDRVGTGDSSADDTSIAYDLFGGYRFSRFFALEAGYTDFGDFGLGDFRTSSRGFMINPRVIWPIAKHFELNFVAGGVWVKRDMSFDGFSADASGFVPKLALGFAVPVSERLAFSFEWTQYLEWDLGFDDDFDVFTDDISTYSVGVRWRF